MHRHNKITPPSGRRASTLLLVIFMTVVVMTIVGSIMNYCATEARLNKSDLLMQEARLAAEATLNHGMAQLRRRFDRTRQLSTIELEPHRTSALQLEPGFLSLMADTRAQVPERYIRPDSWEIFRSAPLIVGGVVVNGGNSRNLVIDPFTALPQQGAVGVPTNASLREVRVYAKATVSDPRLGSRTAYARQTFQILDRSLFGNTVYYNGLLEVFPGANMNLGMGGGPIYAPEVRIGNNPSVHTRVESSGDFRIGRYNRNDLTNSSAKLTDFSLFGTNNPDLYLRDLKNATATSGPSALQTGMPDFREQALQAFNGGLLTSEHGIVGQSAVGLEFLRELNLTENPSAYLDSNGQFDQAKFDRLGSNYGHLLIEPPQQLRDLSLIPEGAEREREEAFNEIEKGKWSNLASIAIEVDPATNDIRMYYQPMNDQEAKFDSSGYRIREEIAVSDVFKTAASRFWTVERFAQPQGKNKAVTQGIYDYRQAAGSDDSAAGKINLIKIDMGKMRKWVEESWTGVEVGELTKFPVSTQNGGMVVFIFAYPIPIPTERTGFAPPTRIGQFNCITPRPCLIVM